MQTLGELRVRGTANSLMGWAISMSLLIVSRQWLADSLKGAATAVDSMWEFKHTLRCDY